MKSDLNKLIVVLCGGATGLAVAAAIQVMHQSMVGLVIELTIAGIMAGLTIYWAVRAANDPGDDR